MREWRCLCGAVNKTGETVCEVCGHDSTGARAASPESTKHCSDCDAPGRFWHELTPGEDAKYRCASCHFAYLGRRAYGTNDDSLCTEPGCTRTVAEHRAECRAIVERSWLKPVLAVQGLSARRHVPPAPQRPV